MKKTIITISRQYGSGGHDIGKKLADELKIPYFDYKLISKEATKQSGIGTEFFETAEDIPSNNFLYSLSMLAPSTEVYGMSLNEKVFRVQSSVIKDLAQKQSCIIVGRCSDYILKDFENCIHIFIVASLKTRVKRAISEYNLPKENAEKKVIKTDKCRETYYNYHTDQKWGNPSNYDLIINTDKIEIDNAVKIIKSYIDLRINEIITE